MVRVGVAFQDAQKTWLRLESRNIDEAEVSLSGKKLHCMLLQSFANNMVIMGIEANHL